MEVPTKVNSSNVLANRNVNAPSKDTLVTKPPLAFSNKLGRCQKSKINYFTVSPGCQTVSALSGTKVTPAPTKSDNQSCSGNGLDSTGLDTSREFPVDDWDDFDDFETPAKSKNESFSSEISVRSSNPSKIPELNSKNGEQSSMETEELEQAYAVSPGPSLTHKTADLELDDSPVKMSRKHPPAHLRSIISDSEEDNEEQTGK